MKLKGTEDEAQIAVFEWAKWKRSKYPALEAMYHVPNEGKRTKAAGANLKRQGMKAGVSDICLPCAVGEYNNLYIELKVGKNVATPDQLTFIDTINSVGGKALVVYEADNAIEVLAAYLEGRIDSLEVKDNTYPADKAKRINAKKYLGFCGEDCRVCDNKGCLGRAAKRES
ncbi:MAG: hypothetical protein ACERKZ_03340 [Lachnotalea sp.]